MIVEFLPEDKVIWRKYEEYPLYEFSNDFRINFIADEELQRREHEDPIAYNFQKDVILINTMEKRKTKRLYLTRIHRELFPEYYPSEEDYKYFETNEEKITIPLNILQKFIHPNKFIQIYDTTERNTSKLRYSGREIKTSCKKIYPDTKNNITLQKGHKYIALGTLTYVKFDEKTLIPKNNKAHWCETETRLSKERNGCKKVNKTGIWD